MTIRASTFYGKPIDGMSKDELFDVIEHLSNELKRYQADGMSRAMALGRVEMMKRGEGFDG